MTQEIGEWDETRTKYQILNVFRQHGRDYLTTILTTGLYALHLKRWFPYYDQSNLMIIDGGKLLSDPGPIIEEIQDFYDLPKLLLKEDYVRDPDTNYFCFKDWKTGELRRLPKSKQRTRNGNAKLTDEETVRLKSFYKTHNEALFKMLNRTFNWVWMTSYKKSQRSKLESEMLMKLNKANIEASLFFAACFLPTWKCKNHHR